jgi:ELWxxDGT repeat protein
MNGSSGALAGNLLAFNGLLYFTAWTPTTGYQVYQTDGTSSGTVRDTSLNTGSSHIPCNFVVSSAGLYFTAPGATMWRWS